MAGKALGTTAKSDTIHLKVGNDVLAMSEWPSGDLIGVHNAEYLGGYQYQDQDWEGPGWRSLQSPAHEQVRV